MRIETSGNGTTGKEAPTPPHPPRSWNPVSFPAHPTTPITTTRADARALQRTEAQARQQAGRQAYIRVRRTRGTAAEAAAAQAVAAATAGAMAGASPSTPAQQHQLHQPVPFSLPAWASPQTAVFNMGWCEPGKAGRRGKQATGRGAAGRRGGVRG